ncbi:MAG TPA: SDR family oxidoreductase [Anaerolineae bacterium]|jgi:NAD(P)-dependent dehydrogenase (short-subunit alcohol dehydrogenase family)
MNMFDLGGKVAVITGGSGIIGSGFARGLFEAGVRLCLVGRNLEKVKTAARNISSDTAQSMGLSADVTHPSEVERISEAVLTRWGKIDILINCAGGNMPAATTGAQTSFFDLSPEALRAVFDLNLTGSIIPSQIIGRTFASQKSGVIINISSMAAVKPLTRVVGYAAAKAAIDNFTRWLAVYMATEYSPAIRVNAIAPGFLLGEQNRAMLVDAKTGELTPRGHSIIDHTPMRRFGVPEELNGTLVWLCSEAARFVTGIVVPVDGGFSAFGGV